MEYFEILNLKKEPFSNSPDPDFFFQSRQHVDCLQKLEIALRLRRGLNVVIGDVGTGKTTLCRQLIRKFSNNADVETYLILDPHFLNPSDFLSYIAGMLEEDGQLDGLDDGAVKERLKQRLFHKGIDEKKTIVLIIDEGQKIPAPCLEILRELLNYETNEYKLLQIVIFAQKEFDSTIEEYANFADRINLYHVLEPLGLQDTLRMIRFRLSRSSEEERSLSIFTFPALMAVYLSTGGYPRKIVNLCHRCMLTIIVQNRSKAGWFLVRSCVKRIFHPQTGKRKFYAAAVLMVAVALMLVSIPGYKSLMDFFPRGMPENESQKQQTAVFVKPALVPEKKVKPYSTKGLAHQKAAIEWNKRDSQNINEESPDLDIKTISSIEAVETVEPVEPTETIKTGQMAVIHEAGIPVMLGRVTLKKGESLWLMIKRIYGTFNMRILKRLTSTNPQIINPDNVDAGTRINFPAIRSEVKVLDIKCWWVYLDEKDRLDAAFEKLRQYPEGAPSVRLVPHMKADGDLKFTVVSKEYFFDREKAELLLSRIPEEFAATARVFPGWRDKDTVFFADPFLS